MKKFFVTGTDTDCGKTYITASILDYLPSSAAIKPIASGCIREGELLIKADALLLTKRDYLRPDTINPWAFEKAVSPHIAAAREGRQININKIIQYCEGLKLPQAEYLFIEGAGGLLVPLNEEETWVDFLIEYKIPVILVVGMKLGCLNHALLTDAVLNRYGITPAGWIANCLDPYMLELNANIETLKKKLSMPLLDVVAYQGKISQLQGW
ncbi:MAG: dethiobiotin synthase [Legionella sp. 40-6]|nr:dethiobiotin synthase [Legionella sp.]OJY34583.1 MAG: dethiobiotin synthase [Legionella sp. 40-6]